MNPFDTTLKKYVYDISQSELLDNIQYSLCSTGEFNDLHKNVIKDQNSLAVLHVNIRSINANFSKLKQMLYELSLDFNVIILTEIWGSNITFFTNALTDYCFIYELPDNSLVGGVGMFIKNNLSFIIREDLKMNSTSYKIESLFVEVIRQDKTFLIAGIYRHPNNNINLFKDDLDAI